MRSVSSGLLGLLVIGAAVTGCLAEAQARGGGGAAVGGRGGAGLHRGAGWGGRHAAFGGRFGPGARFGRGHGVGRIGFGSRYGYGFGDLGAAYGGYGYGLPSAGSFGPAYDPPTSIGIPPSPVAPPAIYVLDPRTRANASGAVAPGRRAARTLAARSDSGVAGGARIIRVGR